MKITIRNTQYPIRVQGNGIKCLSVGLGSQLQRALANNFYEDFQVYSSDLYWIENNELKEDIDDIFFEMILNDLKYLQDQLSLNGCLLIAHSAFAIIALEFAKKYPEALSGIIMIGSPVNCNPEVAKINNQIFEENADLKRKKLDQEFKKNLYLQDLSDLSFSEIFKIHNIANAPRYWYQADYNCCPWSWNELKNLPPKMTNSIFKKSGHWLHYEEPDLFVQRVIEWATNLD